MNKYNFAFFGTPDVASHTLDILFEGGYIPKVIITSPDKKSGRGMQVKETEVSIWAKSHTIPCLKPEKLDEEFINEFKNFNVDLSIVIAYGKIIPEALISEPDLGTINIHYSLLPKHRGASPTEETLLHNEEVTGISIQQMAFKLDSGPIIARQEVSIEKDETKTELLKQLTQVGGELLVNVLPDIFEQKITKTPQDENQATYCKKIKKEDGLLDLNNDALINFNKYRAYDGWPGTYFFILKNDKNIRVNIKKAKYENNSFIVERVIPEGKKEINYVDFVRTSI